MSAYPALAAIRPTDVPGLDILPADVSLADANLALADQIGRERRLSVAMEDVEAGYDFIILDTSPQRSLLTVNALAYLHEAIIPVDPGLFAVAGLGQLDAAAQRQHGRSFGASTPPQRTALLQRLDQQPTDFADELAGFYRMARQLTMDGYTNSKYFMTKEVVYELVPSRYNGHYPVSKVDLANPRHGQS